MPHALAMLGILTYRDVDSVLVNHGGGNDFAGPVRGRIGRLLILARNTVDLPELFQYLDTLFVFLRCHVKAVAVAIAGAKHNSYRA